MNKTSSCIAVFRNYADAVSAINGLKAVDVDQQLISLVGKDIQEGKVAEKGLSSLDSDLILLGVQEANLHCYNCMIHAGSFMVIVMGDYTQVEQAANHLEKYAQADVSIHFNAS
jgi:tRNA A58 N-methylase Trm61